MKQTADIAADKLMRVRSNRLFYGAPPIYRGHGRPRIHGDKFKLNDSTTWWAPDQRLEVNDSKMGRVCICLWCNLHFQQSSKHSMNLIQIQRLDELGEPKIKPLWLVWIGIEMPALFQLWRFYFRRFAIDHWYRFALATTTLDASKSKHSPTV